MTIRWWCVLALVLVLVLPLGADAAPRRSGGVSAAGPLGFAMIPEAGSRLIVPLAKPVPVAERRTGDTIRYVLRGARVRGRNDTRPLVTAYFNTPVRGARLERRGGDVHVVIELRAASTPVWRVVERAGGAAALEIDFAAGTFVTAEPIVTLPASGTDDADVADDGPPLWRQAPERAPTRDAPAGRASVRTHAPALRNEASDEIRARMDEKWREIDERRRAAQKPAPRPRAIAPLPKPDPAAEERARELRARKRAQREAVQREVQELGNTRGGAGTATTSP